MHFGLSTQKKVAKATAYKAWAKVDPKLYETIMDCPYYPESKRRLDKRKWQVYTAPDNMA